MRILAPWNPVEYPDNPSSDLVTVRGYVLQYICKSNAGVPLEVLVITNGRGLSSHVLVTPVVGSGGVGRVYTIYGEEPRDAVIEAGERWEADVAHNGVNPGVDPTQGL